MLNNKRTKQILEMLVMRRIAAYLIILGYLRRNAETSDARIESAHDIEEVKCDLIAVSINAALAPFFFGIGPQFFFKKDSRQAGMTTERQELCHQYDAKGNMNVRKGIALVYDYDNRAVSIGASVNVYDYSGQRVKKNGTIYIGKLYECTGGVCTKHIFAGDQRIASKTGSNVLYYHTDHLGSSTVVTDAWGNNVQENYYYPFGETRVGGYGATHYKYTGQEEDPETGLYYYGARYYDPVIGRFVSADSIVPDFSDPQSLNRYSYVENSPLLLTDPNGQFPWLAGLLIGAAIGGVTSAIMHTNIFQGILTGAISGVIFAGVGNIIANPANAVTHLSQKVALHAMGGMASGLAGSLISRGDAGLAWMGGMMSGGFGTLAGAALPNNFATQLAGQSLAGGLAGGVTAEIAGGSFGKGFAQGAETAAIGFLANGCLHDGNCLKKIKEAINKFVGVSWSHGLLGESTSHPVGGGEEGHSYTAFELGGTGMSIQLGDQPGKNDIVGEIGIGLGRFTGLGFYFFSADYSGNPTKGGLVVNIGGGLGSPVYIKGDMQDNSKVRMW